MQVPSGIVKIENIANYVQVFYHTLYNTTYVYCIVATVSFEEREYSIFESDREPLKVVLVLSKLSSFNVTVQVMDTANTATGILLIS